MGFERCLYSVGEEDRQVKLCVDITVPRRQDIGTITFNLMVETQNGSAGISCSRSQNIMFYFDWLWRDVYNHVCDELAPLLHKVCMVLSAANVHGTLCMVPCAGYLLQPMAKRVYQCISNK